MKIVVHKTSGKETTKKVDLNNNVFDSHLMIMLYI